LILVLQGLRKAVCVTERGYVHERAEATVQYLIGHDVCMS